jgi:hypothetical protein
LDHRLEQNSFPRCAPQLDNLFVLSYNKHVH